VVAAVAAVSAGVGAVSAGVGVVSAGEDAEVAAAAAQLGDGVAGARNSGAHAGPFGLRAFCLGWPQSWPKLSNTG